MVGEVAGSGLEVQGKGNGDGAARSGKVVWDCLVLRRGFRSLRRGRGRLKMYVFLVVGDLKCGAERYRLVKV